MEHLVSYKQGKEPASVYFLKIKQFAALAGINLADDPHTILHCE